MKEYTLGNRLTKTYGTLAPILLLLALGFFFSNAAPAAAQNSPTAVVSTGSLNVRSGPGVGYEVLYIVQHQQTVTMIGRNAGTTWIKIRTPQGDGWVNRNMIWPNFPVERLGVITVNRLNLAAAVTTGSLNIRSGPGTDHAVINRVGLDAVIGISGRNSAGSWVLIDAPSGKAGWVNATHLNVYGNLFTLPVSTRTLPAPAAAAGGTTSTNRSATTTVSAANATSWPEFIYIRQGPDRSATPLQTIYAGTSLTMLSRTGDTEWIQVRSAEGTTGYVLSIELRPSVPFNQLSVVGSSGNTPAAAGRATTTTGNTPASTGGDLTVRGTATVFVEGLNIRSGPNLSSPIVDGAYYNARLSIIGRTADNAWVKIIAPNGTVGWVSAQFIWTSVYVYTLPVVN